MNDAARAIMCADVNCSNRQIECSPYVAPQTGVNPTLDKYCVCKENDFEDL